MFTLPLHLSIAFLIGLWTASVAVKNNRSRWGWFTIGFLFGIIGLIALYIIISIHKKKQQVVQAPIPQPYIDGPIDRFWYYLDLTRKQQGPMSHNALTQLWKRGEVNLNTLVWHEELPNWKELQELIKFKI